ncbi:MAG: hypothetical protein II696_05405 [Firmicutes bacterium]|nr:hypothetical protein [Bacillota bacterium]
MADSYNEQTKEYQTLASDVAIGENDRAIDGGLDREIARCDKMLEQMEKATKRGWWHLHWGTPENFEKMRKAVEDYRDMQLEMKQRIETANSPEHKDDPAYASESAVSLMDLDKLRMGAEAVKDAARDYYTGKGPEADVTNPYTKSRMEISKLAMQLGERGMAENKDELASARKNEDRMLEKTGMKLNKKIDEIEAQKNKAPVI